MSQLPTSHVGIDLNGFSLAIKVDRETTRPSFLRWTKNVSLIVEAIVFVLIWAMIQP
jgi:hypothetical protein